MCYVLFIKKKLLLFNNQCYQVALQYNSNHKSSDTVQYSNTIPSNKRCCSPSILVTCRYLKKYKISENPRQLFTVGHQPQVTCTERTATRRHSMLSLHTPQVVGACNMIAICESIRWWTYLPWLLHSLECYSILRSTAERDMSYASGATEFSDGITCCAHLTN